MELAAGRVLLSSQHLSRDRRAAAAGTAMCEVSGLYFFSSRQMLMCSCSSVLDPVRVGIEKQQ